MPTVSRACSNRLASSARRRRYSGIVTSWHHATRSGIGASAHNYVTERVAKSSRYVTGLRRCGFRFDPATHSDLISATRSDRIPATHSNPVPATGSDRFPATPWGCIG